MKRYVPVLVFFYLSSSLLARTHPGKSSIAARLTDFGQEFGYGRMISPVNMLLADIDMNFASSDEESKAGETKTEGPFQSTFEFTFWPEYRYYMAPTRKLSPYFGVFGMLGVGKSSSETPAGDQVNKTSGSSLSVGLGASAGVELFLSEYLSLAIHARVAQYTFKSTQSETDTGFSKVEQNRKQNSFKVDIDPAIYVRIYF